MRAAVRLSHLQKPMVPWVAADAKRTRRMSTRSHPALVAALPSAKGHLRHRLRRLATPGVLVMTRTPGGQTESVSLTAAGRQKARTLAGSDAEGGTIQQHNGVCTDQPQRRYATTRTGGTRARSTSTRTTLISFGATASRGGCYTRPVSAQPRRASPGKSRRINEV